MSALDIVLRIVPLVAFAGGMLHSATGHRPRATTQASPNGSGRAPLVANFSAFGLYIPSLLLFPGSSAGSAAVWLASSGAFIGVAGAILVVTSRAELGSAWSFVPRADQGAGLVTTGPYRLVRHPIYLGLALLAMGEALAFGSWPAVVIVLSGIIPTFAWRARAEEKLLSRTFGDCYSVYRQRTKTIIPSFSKPTSKPATRPDYQDMNTGAQRRA